MIILLVKFFMFFEMLKCVLFGWVVLIGFVFVVMFGVFVVVYWVVFLLLEGIGVFM